MNNFDGICIKCAKADVFKEAGVFLSYNGVSSHPFALCLGDPYAKLWLR